MTSPLRRGPAGVFGLSAEATQVVQWHNRHPLAVRIRPDHVQGMGWVLFPFTGPAQAAPAATAADGTDGQSKASLRERAMQRSVLGAADGEPTAMATMLDRKALKAAFSDAVLPGVTLEVLSAFAQLHGHASALAPEAKPRREAKLDTALAREHGSAQWLHLPTASIELGTRRSRVLLGGDRQVLGKRLYSRAKVVALVLLPLLVAAGVLAWRYHGALGDGEARPPLASANAALGMGREGTPAPSASASADAVQTSAFASASASAPATASAASTPPQATATATATMPAPVVAAPATSPLPPANLAASAAPTSPLALSVPPTASGELKSIRPALDPDIARTARRESAALRAASAAGMADTAAAAQSPAQLATVRSPAQMAAASNAGGPPAAAKSAGRATPDAAAPRGTVYALVARTTRSKAASEILLAALAPESARAAGGPRAEVLPADGGYRASLWPFATREAAEQTQKRLQAGGLATQLVEF